MLHFSKTSCPTPTTLRICGGARASTPRNIAVINFIYNLPFLKKNGSLLGRIAGGWRVTGVTQFQSGTVGTAATGDDFAGVGPGSGSQIWNRSGEFELPRSERKFSQGITDQNFWYRTKNADGTPIFTAPAAGTFTSQFNRGIIRTPGFQNWNIGLMKDFRITERQRIRFQAEGFNWINHPNWSTPDGNPNSATFGRVTAKIGNVSPELSGSCRSASGWIRIGPAASRPSSGRRE